MKKTPPTPKQLEQSWTKSKNAILGDPNRLPDGIHTDLPFDDYVKIDAVNASSLKKVKDSLAHYKATPAREDSKALRFGSIAHCGALEPDKFHDRYVVIPNSLAENIFTEKKVDGVLTKVPSGNPRATTEYKERLAKFMEQHANKQEVSQDWFDKTLAQIRNIAADPVTGPYFVSGVPEVTLIWTDPKTQMRCKARVDWTAVNITVPISWLHAILIDLKTAAEIHRWNLSDWDYQIQQAHYESGWEVLTGRLPEFRFAVVESDDPYTVWCAPTHPDDRATGLFERRVCMNALFHARRLGNFPFPNRPEFLRLSKWHDREWTSRLPPAYTRDPEPGDFVVEGTKTSKDAKSKAKKK